MDSFVLQTSDSDIQNGEFLGRLGFAANEADTGDARAVSAVVSAMAEAPFTSTSNPTSIVFATAFDGDATNKLKITSSGNFLPFVSGIYDIGSGTLPFRKVFTDELRVGDYNFPTADGTSGHVLSTDGAGQLSFISVSSAGDNFVNNASFNSSNNELTLERTGSLLDVVVTIPFTDTNTTYTAGSGLLLDSSNEFHANVSGIQSVASNSTTSTASRTYAIQIDPNDQLVVNVPWVDTDTDTDTDTNDHLDDVTWDDTNGKLTFSFTGPSNLNDIVTDIDGRYVLESCVQGTVWHVPIFDSHNCLIDSIIDITTSTAHGATVNFDGNPSTTLKLHLGGGSDSWDLSSYKNGSRDTFSISHNTSKILYLAEDQSGDPNGVGIFEEDPVVELDINGDVSVQNPHTLFVGIDPYNSSYHLEAEEDSSIGQWAFRGRSSLEQILLKNSNNTAYNYMFGASKGSQDSSTGLTLVGSDLTVGDNGKVIIGAGLSLGGIGTNNLFRKGHISLESDRLEVRLDDGDNGGSIVLNSDAKDIDFNLKSSVGQGAIYVTGSNGFVGINTGITAPLYNLDVNGKGRFLHADGDCGLIVEDTGGSGVMIGDCAYAASSAFTGMKHTSHTNSQEYMIISSGYSTFVSSAANANTYIRGGENDNTYQLVVGTGYLAVGSANQIMKINSQKVEFNVNNEDYDFVVNGFGVNNLLSIDAVENTVGVGTTSVTGKFNVYNESTNGGGKGYGAIFGGYNNGTAVLINASVPQDTVYVNNFYSYCYPSNNSTISQMFHFRATPPEGAGTIGVQHGFYAGPSLKHANQNRGFTSFIPSGDNNQNYNIYAGGTAKNYVSGVLGIGTDSPQAKLDVNGTVEFDNLVRWEYPDKALDTAIDDLGYFRLYDETNGIAGMGVSGSSFNIGTSGNINLRFIGQQVEFAKFDTAGSFIFNDGRRNSDFVVYANNSVNPLIYADADSGTYGRLGIGRTPGNHVVDVSGSMRINPLPAATVTATLNRNPGYPTIKSEGNNPANNWLILDSAGNSNRLALNYFNNDDVVLCHGSTLSSSTGTKRGGVGIGQSAAPGAYALRVEGATSAFNAFQIPDANFRVFGSIDDSLIYADAGLNRVGINTNFADLDYKLVVSYEPNVDDGVAILRDGSKTDGILIGEQAYTASPDYQGITHPEYTGSSDYMLISAGAHTFVGARATYSTYIRAGGNNSAFQAVINSSQFSIGSTVLGTAHFLVNSTGAYVKNDLDVGGHTTLNGGLTLNGDADVFGNIQTIGHGVGHADDGIFLAYPGGGTDHNSGSGQTGYLKITLPVTWNSSMVNFALDVYEYNPRELKTFKLGGYLYAGSSTNSPPYSLARWHQTSAQLDASKSALQKFNVQFLHDGTKCAIYISKFDSNNNDLGAASAWSYCQSSIRDVFVGYNGLSLTDWEDGWDVGFTTTLGNYNTIANVSTQQTTCARAYHLHESHYVFNEYGEDVNFRVEGLDSPYLLHTDAGTNSVAIGSPVSASTKLYVLQDNLEFASNGSARGLWTYQNSQTTADCVSFALGSQTYAFKYVDNGVSDTGYVLAGDFTGVAKGSGYLEQAYGVRAYGGIHTGSTGTVNSAFGFRSRVLNLGTGTATINNGYGLYIDPVAGTNHYGVFQVGPTDDNYFAGTVGIGTTYTSNAKLTVADGPRTTLAIDTGGNMGSSEIGIDFIDRHLATSQGIEGQITSFVRSQRQGTGGSFDLIFGTVDVSDLAADADEKVRITSNGILGIGSTTQGVDPTTVGADVGIHIAADHFPEVHFTNDVSGHGSPSGCNIQLNTNRFITTNRIPDSSIEFYTFDTSSVTKQRLRLGHTFASFNGIKEDIDFYVWGNNVTNPLIYAQSNVDRVGINELTPAYTLDVNGDVRLRGVLRNDTNASTVAIYTSLTNSNQTKRITGNDTAWEGIDNQKWRIATPDNSTSAYKALFDVSLVDYRVTTYHGASINFGRYSAADGGDFAVRGEGGTGAGTDGDNLIRTDATNHRVGIFNSSPQYRLDVKGSFSADSVNVNDAFTLPTVDGSADQVLLTNGAGVVAWADINSNGIVNGRLSLKSANPIPAADQTAKTTIYFVPYKGNQISLYSGSAWVTHSFSALSLSLSGYAADTNFDIFIYDNSGTLTLESAAWTDDTTRATALTTQDGVYVKSGATTRRYLGTIRTTPTTGQCEDSIHSRFVWNHYNQVKRYLRSGVITTADTNVPGGHTYSTAVMRPWYNNTTVGEGRHNYVLGLGLIVSAKADGQTRHGYIAYGIDSTTVGISPLVFNGSDTVDFTLMGGSDINVAAGYHYAQGLQQGVQALTSIFHSIHINTHFQG